MPPSERQYAHSPDVLFNHPPDSTDSFVLFIKSAMLMSRVSTFNRRFLKLNSLGVSGMSVENASPRDSLTLGGLNAGSSSSRRRRPDAREVEEFAKLENEVESFAPSFPEYLREPITQDGSVDWTLLNAYLAANLCVC